MEIQQRREAVEATRIREGAGEDTPISGEVVTYRVMVMAMRMMMMVMLMVMMVVMPMVVVMVMVMDNGYHTELQHGLIIENCMENLKDLITETMDHLHLHLHRLWPVLALNLHLHIHRCRL